MPRQFTDKPAWAMLKAMIDAVPYILLTLSGIAAQVAALCLRGRRAALPLLCVGAACIFLFATLERDALLFVAQAIVAAMLFCIARTARRAHA